MVKQVGIIIQARTGSTRLPGKMVMPFYNEQSILEVIIDRFSPHFKTILATTVSDGDTVLAELAQSKGIDVYRGSEADVLSRFVETGEKHELDIIIRLCADNPFVNLELLKTLVDAYQNEDYFSFRYSNGKPTILGHLGLFCEITTLETLKKVQSETQDPLFLEHVTNYIYNRPEEYKVRLIDLPTSIHSYEGIRLTVDTKGDFEITQDLFGRFGEVSTIPKVNELIEYIRSNVVLLSTMQHEIELNSK